MNVKRPFFESVYKSLGLQLSAISENEEMRKSPELRKHSEDALVFFAELGRLWPEVINELNETRKVLDDLTRDPDDHCNQPPNYERYKQMASEGSQPNDVAAVAIAGGLDRIRTVAALRAAFNMNLRAALDVVDSFDTTAND
jgi:hypothetical protein